MFSDISTNAQTKEEYLSKGCQARIRGYLTKAEQGLKAGESSDKIISILSEFRSLLKEHKYNGHYFDRGTKLEDKICNQEGLFRCEGRFDQNQCNYGDSNQNPDLFHSINPYESSEARILFSTWNLDHV